MITRVTSYLLSHLLLRQAIRAGRDKHEAKRIIDRELASILDTVSAHFIFQKHETVILTERLRRRYDIGLAMNESTQRAQKLREADGAKDTPILSASQLKALKFQQQYLQGIV